MTKTVKESAGILVFRRKGSVLEVLLAHPGGPIWAHRDQWSIPKGELEPGEDHLSAAQREFDEEMGSPAPWVGELLDLGTAKSSSGKVNYIWAVKGDYDLAGFQSNNFEMEWPPKSGRMQEYPENDRVGWFPVHIAAKKVYGSQVIFLERLCEQLGVDLSGADPQQSLL